MGVNRFEVDEEKSRGLFARGGSDDSYAQKAYISISSVF